MSGCCSCLCPHRAWNNVLPADNASFGTPLSNFSSPELARHPSRWESRGRQPTQGEDDCGTTAKNLRASICLKLTIFVCMLVVIAAGVPALVLWLKAKKQLVEEIERRLVTVSTLRQEQLRDYLVSEADKTELISTRVIISNFLANTSRSNRSLAIFDLSSAVGVISDFNFAACYDSNGQLLIATADNVFEKSINQTDLEAIRTEGVQFAYPTRTSYGWIYNISRPIFRRQVFIGVLITRVNATKLVNLYYDRTGLQRTGELLIGIPEGVNTVRLLFPALQNPNRTNLNITSRRGAMGKAIDGQSGIMVMRDYSGSKVIAAYRPVEFLHWGLLAKLDIDEAYAPVKSVRTVIITTIVILLFVGVLASVGLAKIFTRPIVELGRAAVALGQGDMTTRVRKGTVLLRDELADLKDIFNSMAFQISHHHQILEHRVTERTADLARANEVLENEINERRKIELELEKAKNIAMAANRSKSEFLANMSHEIRTPLNAIINFTEFCLDTKVTPEQKEHLDQVRFAAQILLRLITDILDFSKIEAGKLEMEEIEFSLHDQLEHAVSVLAARALENNIELCCSFDVDVPDQILGDPGRLLQIFVNLIGNGIKFTKKGEVVASVSVKSKEGDAVELLFKVKDSGLGIPESKQPLLFQAFSQVDSSTQRVYGGTGLGLVISSRLAAAMGGKMWVESDGIKDHGSVFWFTARFRVSRLSSTQKPSIPGLFKDVRGLVVDDNETSRRILVDLMKNLGMIAHSVGSVEAASCILQKAAATGHNYDIVLLDLWLKGADASELISLLHQQPYLLRKPVLSIVPQEKGSGKEFTPASEGLGNRTCEEDQPSPNGPGREGGKDNPDSSNLVAETMRSEKLSLECTENMFSNKHNSHINSTSNASNSNCVSVNNKVVSDSCSGKDQHNTRNLRCAGQVPDMINVSSNVHQSLSSVIMLTSVNHADINRCKELGVSNHVSKPIKRALLVRALHSALGAESPLLERKKSSGGDTPSRRLHILVAEDNVVNQNVAVILLKKWGHTAVLACNGEEAVEKASKDEFDLILMDVQMPICDGFEATAQIREFEKSQQRRNPIPIVAMTAHAMTGDGERCIAAGMDHYVSKPLNSKKLQELLQSVAKESVSRASGKSAGN